jgi:hypothetical protein
MTSVVNLEQARRAKAARRGFRNWINQLGEDCSLETHLGDISAKTIALLAEGKERSSFYLFDLIMNLQNLGSGFDFHDLGSKEKLGVMERSLFLLDRIRFEVMKRLEWLASYPGEEFSVVELVTQYDEVAPRLQAQTPSLKPEHPDFARYRAMNTLQKETLIRELIPKALQKIQDQSSTL